MDDNILQTLESFFDEMGYTRNKHVLGVFSYATESENELGLIIVRSLEGDKNSYKGLRTIDDVRIKYYETTINELYLTVERKLDEQNNDYLYLIGSAKILFDTSDQLRELQKFTNKIYEKDLPAMDVGESYEMLANISDMIQKLKQFAEEDRPDFNGLYYLTLDAIRVFYHKIMGYPSINATEVTSAYTNKIFQQKYFKEDMPENPFNLTYLMALNDMSSNRTQAGKYKKLEKLERVFVIAKHGFNFLESDYRIPIRTRNR